MLALVQLSLSRRNIDDAGAACIAKALAANSTLKEVITMLVQLCLIELNWIAASQSTLDHAAVLVLGAP